MCEATTAPSMITLIIQAPGRSGLRSVKVCGKTCEREMKSAKKTGYMEKPRVVIIILVSSAKLFPPHKLYFMLKQPVVLSQESNPDLQGTHLSTKPTEPLVSLNVTVPGATFASLNLTLHPTLWIG